MGAVSSPRGAKPIRPVVDEIREFAIADFTELTVKWFVLSFAIYALRQFFEPDSRDRLSKT